MDERDAISRLKQGDISGLEVLVHMHYVRAVRAAYLVTRDCPLAEDVVQAAFLKVYDRAGQFDSSRPFAPWFFRIVVNDAAKAAAKQARDVSLDHKPQGEDVSLADLLPDSHPSPEELAERAEVQQAVWEALGRLSPTQRMVVVLRYHVGLRDAGIAERLGKPLGTVKRRLHDARSRLRVLLGGAADL